MKLWAHHISVAAKNLSMNVVLPSLPDGDFERLGLNITELEMETRAYNKSLSCVAGHSAAKFNVEEDAQAYDWPHWPSVSHWRALGHGPYPFWQFGPPESHWKRHICTRQEMPWRSGIAHHCKLQNFTIRHA